MTARAPARLLPRELDRARLQCRLGRRGLVPRRDPAHEDLVAQGEQGRADEHAEDSSSRHAPERAEQCTFSSGQEIRDEIARVVPVYSGVELLRTTGDAIQWGGTRLCEGGTFPTPDGKARFLAVAATVNDLEGFGSKVLQTVVTVSGAASALLYLPEPGGSFKPTEAIGWTPGEDGIGADEARRAASEKRPIFVSVDAWTPTINVFDGRILPVDLAANAESLGVRVLRARTIDEFRSAVEDAKKSDADGPVMVHVETDPLVPAPSSESWWDVPVADVAELNATRDARTTYAENKSNQRLFL